MKGESSHVTLELFLCMKDFNVFVHSNKLAAENSAVFLSVRLLFLTHLFVPLKSHYVDFVFYNCDFYLIISIFIS